MQRDNQGRALLRLPTTMRVAFADAVAQATVSTSRPSSNELAVRAALKNPRTGYRKVPAWTVTRRAKR